MPRLVRFTPDLRLLTVIREEVARRQQECSATRGIQLFGVEVYVDNPKHEYAPYLFEAVADDTWIHGPVRITPQVKYPEARMDLELMINLTPGMVESTIYHDLPVALIPPGRHRVLRADCRKLRFEMLPIFGHPF